MVGELPEIRRVHVDGHRDKLAEGEKLADRELADEGDARDDPEGCPAAFAGGGALRGCHLGDSLLRGETVRLRMIHPPQGERQMENEKVWEASRRGASPY